MVESGVNPELLLKGGYGHSCTLGLAEARHVQALDGREQQMVLEVRPADPSKAYGFVGVVVSLKDLSASIWLWYRDNGKWSIKKVIEIPAEAADPATLPPLLQGFKAVPPLVTDINLSLDDKYLYVSCWETGEFQQYDVSDPFHPKLRDHFDLAGSYGVRRTRVSTGPLMGGRKWWKSAATATNHLPTRSTLPGMSNFIQMEFAAG